MRTDSDYDKKHDQHADKCERWAMTNLNICRAKRCDAGNFGSGYAWRFETEHGLEIAIQLCYSRRHRGERILADTSRMMTSTSTKKMSRTVRDYSLRSGDRI
jgi:hypothetical protein